MADAKLGGREILKTFEDHLFHVSFAITISILEIIEIGRASDIHAAIPGHHAIGKSEAVGENSALVIFAITIGVFEQDDLADWRFAFAGAYRVAAIFDNVHTAFFVPVNSDWRNDHGL